MTFLPSIQNLLIFIVIVYSLFNPFKAVESLIDLDKYKNSTCIKSTNTLIDEIDDVMLMKSSQSQNCLLQLSYIIKSLCPFEQSILYNAYQINTDSSRCFDVNYYKANFKLILDFQLSNTLFALSSTSMRNTYLCFNNLLEDYLTDEELEKLIVPNNILNIYQSIQDSKTLAFIENYTNAHYYIREYFLKPISQWKDYFVYENTENKKIINLKIDSSKIKDLINDYVSYIKSIFSRNRSSLIANLKYTKIIASSKKCSNFSLLPNDNNVHSINSDYISLNSSNKTHYSSQFDILSPENIYKFQDFNHSVTYEMKSFLKEYIINDYEDAIFNHNKFSEQGYNLSLLKTKFDLVKDFKVECKKYFPSFINLNLNQNHSLYRKVFNIINGDLPFKTSTPIPDELLYTSILDSLFNKIKDTDYTFDEILSNNISYTNIEQFFFKSDKLKLFKKLLFFPFNDNQLPKNITNLYKSVNEEFKSDNSTVNSTFPLCLSEIDSISTCNFSEKLTGELKSLLPNRFFENFRKSLILHSKLSSPIIRTEQSRLKINISSDDIIGLMPLNIPDEYFVYENGTCYSNLFNQSDCSELFIKELNTQDLYFAYISVQNHKIFLYFNNKTYENNLKWPEYSLRYGDVDICSMEDMALIYPEYFNIKPECREDIKNKCSSLNLGVGFEKRIFDYYSKLDLYSKCDITNENFSEKECYQFISDVLLSSFQFNFSENMINPYTILYENNNYKTSKGIPVEYLDSKSLIHKNNSLLGEFYPIYKQGSLFISDINSKYDTNNIFLFDKKTFKIMGPKLQKIYSSKFKEYKIDTSDLFTKNRYSISLNLSQLLNNTNSNSKKEFLETNQTTMTISVFSILFLVSSLLI